MKQKETQTLGMPWEKEYGYAQALKYGNKVWLAGQVGHDENGKLKEGMQAQMEQAYNNIQKLLKGFNMTMDNVMEEVVYVTDLDAAFKARKNMGSIVYSNPMLVPSTLIEVRRLSLPGQLIEIKIIAHN
ncbi:MAG TPA: RidA family protein [Parafilimonas sp.]|nr:RidA family protein [Parafilimonas sp.]